MGWWDWPSLLKRTGSTVILLALIALIGSLADAQNRAKYVGYAVLAAAVMAALVFFYALLRAPFLAYEEVRPRAPNKAELAEELERHFATGRELQLDVQRFVLPGVLNAALGAKALLAIRKYPKWCDEVETVLRGKSTEEERFMFASISPKEGPTVEAVNRALEARLGKLRLIISRCLKPEGVAP